MTRQPTGGTRPLGPLELEIMKVVWEQQDVTVAEVVEQIRPGKQLHHNTVMTVMKRLTKKRILERYARDGRSHGYRPRVSRDDVCRQYMEMLKEQFFGGSTLETVAAFLGDDRDRSTDLSAFEELIERLGRE